MGPVYGASSGTGESGEGEGAKDWGAWHVNLVETEPRKIRPKRPSMRRKLSGHKRVRQGEETR